ncbi:hypothetical protein CQA49_06895 [Helicobacter sp. MIT 00-7814]|uniref:RecT family recombinase n=1 Tax=unclassified Helicobacter TaxID=2593540 RepID=UPI000E1E403F|nr:MULTISPECIES: RecT family recombinase [unclassified Helicobacter]RDU53369.1 hypothetical protein CQA49_06895 [Helicobacter sp. MIT 00-7814]RDU54190.1 hypothetical protein CQA37_06135 [Helicobacter sp. MIT 99-10781]
MGSITPLQQVQGAVITQNEGKAKALEYLNSMNLKLPVSQQEQFIELCSSLCLNPFKREIYAVPYGSRFNIIIGFEVYLKKADATGKCQGWKAWTEGSLETNNLKGCIEIYRADYIHPFYHEVDYDEYKQEFFKDGNLVRGFWQNKPKTMIKKVAIAQGFRFAFPNDFKEMPFIEEELQGAGNEVEHQAEIIDSEPTNLSDIQKALQPLGITLVVDGKTATPQGSAVFHNSALLKSLGFTYNASIKKWQHNNIVQDSNKSAENSILDAVVETLNEQPVHHKTMQEIASFEALEKHLESLGVKIEIVENPKGTYFGKISNVQSAQEEAIKALGGVDRGNGIYALSIDELYKEHKAQKKAIQEPELPF